MNAKIAMPIAAALLGGAFAAGRATRALPESAPAPSAEEEETAKSTVIPEDATRSLKAQIAALKRRIAELEAGAEPAPPSDALVPPPETAATNAAPRAFRGGGDWLPEKREKDPQRYVQTTNRMAQFRAHRLNRIQTRLDRLAGVDVSSLSPQERQGHEQLQNLLFQREELLDQVRMDADPPPSSEERQQVFAALGELNASIRDLERAERDALIRSTVQSLGVGRDGAEETVRAIRTIYELTGVEDFGRHHGPPPGGRR